MRSTDAMKCLVTGGAGFIGSHLVRRLREVGHTVRVVDDLSTGSRDRLANVDVELDVEDLAVGPVDEFMRGVEVVFHLAAVPSVPRSVEDPLRSHHAAATATLRTLIAARDAGVRRFVSASSSSVYGDVAAPPMRESMPTAPRSPYAVAKLASEGYTRVFARLFGMETLSVRYFNVFGPYQDSESHYAAVIPRFVLAYLRRARPHVHGDGRQSRDFTYVDNVVEANLLAMTAPALTGESVNVAAGEPRSVLDLLRALHDIFGYWLDPVFEPERPGDIRDSHADITVASRLLGYRPVVGFSEGLRRTVDWYRSRSSSA